MRGDPLFHDIAWAYRMFRIKRLRDKMYFGRRLRFDDALRLRKRLPNDLVAVSYPDAIYMVTSDLFANARQAADERKIDWPIGDMTRD